ncbi:MAG: HAMP domain-containing histidine kinase [Actinobacteria bacterium]|nr:HAMP domain-containing histidine kinase [Actinomycetota bacterium]
MKRLGLQGRIAALFALGALVISALLAGATYDVTRRQLLHERQRTALRAAYFDAAVVQAGLLTRQTSLVDVLRSLDTGTTRRPVIRRGQQWYARTPDTGITSAIPQDLQRTAEAGTPARQRVELAGRPILVTAVPLPSTGVTYYELNDLSELQRTLRLLSLVLTTAALLTAGAGAALGLWAGRRVLRPLRSVARTAASIAEGDLSARLDPAHEPDLARLATSFNAMVDALARRLERDRRFAADVSHELRSPLQTLSAATSVLARGQQGHSAAGARDRAALTLVTEEVDRFIRLVTDLLELARADRAVERERVDLRQLVADECAARALVVEEGPTVDVAVDARRVHQVLVNLLELARADRAVERQRVDLRQLVADECAARELVVEEGPTVDVAVDARRVLQVLVNLLDNAAQYGGGAVAVRVLKRDGWAVVEVDDAGPGVTPAERDLIFDRFARGRAASARGGTEGTGLGLAIVAEHAAAHGGRACVVDRPGGGARFIVELPA